MVLHKMACSQIRKKNSSASDFFDLHKSGSVGKLYRGIYTIFLKLGSWIYKSVLFIIQFFKNLYMFEIFHSKKKKPSGVKNQPAKQETLVRFQGKIPWRRDRLPTPVFLGFLSGSDSKESTHNVRHLGSITELRRSPGGGHDNPLQCSCLENPHGQRSTAGYSPWGHKELDITEWISIVQKKKKKEKINS